METWMDGQIKNVTCRFMCGYEFGQWWFSFHFPIRSRASPSDIGTEYFTTFELENIHTTHLPFFTRAISYIFLIPNFTWKTKQKSNIFLERWGLTEYLRFLFYVSEKLFNITNNVTFELKRVTSCKWKYREWLHIKQNITNPRLCQAKGAGASQGQCPTAHRNLWKLESEARRMRSSWVRWWCGGPWASGEEGGRPARLEGAPLKSRARRAPQPSIWPKLGGYPHENIRAYHCQ